jgi:hypothetical protein
MSEKLENEPAELYEQHKRDARELRRAEVMASSAMQQLVDVVLESERVTTDGQSEVSDKINARENLKEAEQFAAFESNRVAGAEEAYDGTVAAAKEHYEANEEAYHEEAVADAEKGGVTINQ